jgi:hypothetical protein
MVLTLRPDGTLWAKEEIIHPQAKADAQRDDPDLLDFNRKSAV